MSRTIRWGIIGCGKVTEVKSGPAYQQIDGFKIVAVMRRNKDLAKDYAKRHGIRKYYNNAEALILDKEVDAVYIATPPDSHLEYALKVAAAGKICCIEKPMAPSYYECTTINEAFTNKNIPLFIAYYRRSLPRFNKVKDLLESGVIGVSRHVHWQLIKPPYHWDLSNGYTWRTDPKIAYGGYFDDLACHGINLFIQWFGPVKSASGTAINQQGLYKAKDAVAGNWVHENGVVGSGLWNFGTQTRKDEVVIYGSKGKLVFSIFEDVPIQCYTEDREDEFYIENPEHIQYYHVKSMKDHLNGIQIHPSMGEAGVHTAWVMDKILGRLL